MVKGCNLNSKHLMIKGMFQAYTFVYHSSPSINLTLLVLSSNLTKELSLQLGKLLATADKFAPWGEGLEPAQNRLKEIKFITRRKKLIKLSILFLLADWVLSA